MRRNLPIFLLLAAVAWPACACAVPVFRYALENVGAEHYRAIVFSHGLLPSDAEPLLKSLKDCPANLNVETVDVDKPDNPDALKIWNALGSPAEPWVAVRFPRGTTLAWSGALDTAGIATLLDSPARKQMRKQLLDGNSVVWVLLESGDAPRDDQVAEIIQKQSVDLAKRLQLPAADAAPVNKGLIDVPLISAMPVKLEFSVVRVARAAPEEKFFAAQLLQPELNKNPNDLDPSEPLVFPVFGRGKALPALKANDKLPETLTAAAQFLTAACSCEIKEMSPGVDLLIAADWDTEMTLRYPRAYYGTFAGYSDASQKPGTDVVGSFDADATAKKPGQKYLVKVENGNKAVLDTLKRYDGKRATIMGKLQDVSPDAEARYIIVTSVIESSAIPPKAGRRKLGGT